MAPDSPLEFFLKTFPDADTVPQRVGLIFITIVRMWLQLGPLRMLLPVALVALVALAVSKPHVRGSRLVQIGFSILLFGIVPLLLAAVLGSDNPIGLGMLFAFLTPIGLVVTVVGTTLAFLKNR